jgi:hypothetical protein
MMRKVWVVLSVLLLGHLSEGDAQDDFRHLDEGRPLRVEDAYPIKYLEWEWEVGFRGQAARGGVYDAAGLLEVKVGVARNFQFGVESHTAILRTPSGTQIGVEGFQAHLLFNPNQEGTSTPALGVRIDLISSGLGEAGRADFGGRVRTMATRTIGAVRAHLNAGYVWASSADAGSFWSGGLALDHALGLSSRLLAADVYLEVPSGGGPVRAWLDGGARIQLRKSVVLDVGLFTRIDRWSDGEANIGFTAGLSRGFGLSSLMSVPDYPDPPLRE